MGAGQPPRYAMRLLALLGFALAMASAQARCPSTRATYCVCRAGDHGSSRYQCRTNDGRLSWESNSSAPVGPCPIKYEACALINRVDGSKDETPMHLVGDFVECRKDFTKKALVVNVTNTGTANV